MIYADFVYYRDTYLGTLSEAEFRPFERQASAYLDLVTFGRSAELVQGDSLFPKLQDACCAVVDAYALNERGGGIASETNDGISVNYVAGVSRAKTDNERLHEACVLYLGNTDLLYRGVTGC